MNQSEIRQKHLSELKKLSEQLRNSTQNSTGVDFNTIKSILNATQSISRNNSQQSLISNRFSQIKDSRFLAKQKNQEKNQTRLNQNANEESKDKKYLLPVFNILGKMDNLNQVSKKESQISNINYDDKNSQLDDYKIKMNQINQQLLKQKQYSAELQKRLSQIQEQLQKVKQNFQELKHDRSIPFFKLRQELSAFATKIPISEEDYDKIQFTTYFSEMDINGITIRNQANGIQKSYKLDQLININYASQELLILKFEKFEEKSEKKTIQTLFLEFKDSQDYRKWDLAIYMNKKLGSCLQKQTKLFQFEPQLIKKLELQSSPLLKKSSTNQSFPIKGNLSSESFENVNHLPSGNDENFKNVEDKQLLKAYIEAKEKQLQLRRMLNSHLISKIQEKKQRQNSPEKGDSTGVSPKSLIGSENISFSNLHQNSKQQQIVKTQRKPQQKLAGLSDMKSNKIPAEKKVQQSEQQGDQLLRLNTVKQVNPDDQRSANDEGFQNYIKNAKNTTQERNILANKKIPEQRTLFLHDQNAEKSKRIQEAVLKLAIELQEKQQKKIKLQKAYVHLRSGYEFVKYASGGWQPHKKKVSLSNDGKQIHFFDIKNIKDIKKYKLSDLTAVQYPKIGKGIQKHVPNAKSNMSKYAVLTFGDKVVELGSQIPENILDFVTQLHLVRQDPANY